MRKLLVITLIAVMVLSMSATAFAADAVTKVAFSDISGHKGEWALTVLGALGVYSGEQGLGNAVKPDDPITRAQFSKVVVEAFGRGAIAKGMAGLVPQFKDANTNWQWAWGYVNCAVIMGIIKGYDDGTFGPNNPVTYAEAVTMLVRAVGGHDAQVPAGLWPYNYIFYAMDNEFIGNIEIIPNLPATRGDVARLLYLAMQINRLDKNGAPITDSAVLANRIVTGTLTAYDLTGKTVNIGGAAAIADTVYLAGAANLDSLLQLSVVAVKDAAGKICAIGRNESAYTVSGVFKQLYTDPNDATKKYYELTNGTKVRVLGNDIPGKLNGDAVEFGLGGAGDDPTPLAGDELVITLGSGNNAVYIVATRWEAEAHITAVAKSTSTTETKITVGGTQYDVLKTVPVTINGSPIDRDSLAAYDVVELALNNASAIFAIRGTRKYVSGTCEEYWTTYPGPVYHAVFGGKEYTTSLNLGLTKGSLYKIWLDKSGELFVVETATTSTNIVLVKGYSTLGPTITVDERGVSKVLTLASGSGVDQNAVGKYGKVDIESLTGKVTGFTELTASGDYTIMSVDAANKTMLLKDNATNQLTFLTTTESEFVIYKEADKTYVGIEGVKVGGTVKADSGWDLLLYTPPS